MVAKTCYSLLRANPAKIKTLLMSKLWQAIVWFVEVVKAT